MKPTFSIRSMPNMVINKTKEGSVKIAYYALEQLYLKKYIKHSHFRLMKLILHALLTHLLQSYNLVCGENKSFIAHSPKVLKVAYNNTPDIDQYNDARCLYIGPAYIPSKNGAFMWL